MNLHFFFQIFAMLVIIVVIKNANIAPMAFIKIKMNKRHVLSVQTERQLFRNDPQVKQIALVS